MVDGLIVDRKSRTMQQVSTHYKRLDSNAIYHVKHTVNTTFNIFSYTQTTQHVIEFVVSGELVYSMMVTVPTHVANRINSTTLTGCVLHAGVGDYKQFVLQCYGYELITTYHQQAV